MKPLPLAATLLCLAAGCVCDLDSSAASFAGSRALDCGTVAAGDDPAAAVACALGAQQRGEPFKVRIDRPGTDFVMADAYVRNSEDTSARFAHQVQMAQGIVTVQRANCERFEVADAGTAGPALDCINPGAESRVCE